MAISNRTFQGRTRFVGNVYTKQIASPESDGNGILIELGKTADNSDLVNFTVDPKNLTVQGKPLVHLDENNKIPESLLPSISVVDIYIEPSRETFFQMSKEQVVEKYGNLPERGDMLIVSEEANDEDNGIWLMTGQYDWNQVSAWIQIQVGVTPKSILNNSITVWSKGIYGVEDRTIITYPNIKNGKINYPYIIQNMSNPYGEGDWSGMDNPHNRWGYATFTLDANIPQAERVNLDTEKNHIELDYHTDFGEAKFGIHRKSMRLNFFEQSDGQVLTSQYPGNGKYVNQNGNLVDVSYQTFSSKSTFTCNLLYSDPIGTSKGPIKISVEDTLGNACNFYTSVYYDGGLEQYYFSEVVEEVLMGYGTYELGIDASNPDRINILMNDYMVIPSNTTVEATIKIEYLNGSMLK